MMRRALLAVVALASCSAVDPVARAHCTLHDVDGRTIDVTACANESAALVLFAGIDCPIARAYSPEIAAIANDYARCIAVRVVMVDVDLDAARAREHAREFGLPGPILLDPEHRMVRALGATITPEAFLVDHTGRLVYAGRIDDRFADLGKPRRAPRTRELRDAIESVIAGRKVVVARTQAVGCLIE
ncbi:MAG: redoxin family protein [Planctomycetota bacterium]